MTAPLESSEITLESSPSSINQYGETISTQFHELVNGAFRRTRVLGWRIKRKIPGKNLVTLTQKATEDCLEHALEIGNTDIKELLGISQVSDSSQVNTEDIENQYKKSETELNSKEDLINFLTNIPYDSLLNSLYRVPEEDIKRILSNEKINLRLNHPELNDALEYSLCCEPDIEAIKEMEGVDDRGNILWSFIPFRSNEKGVYELDYVEKLPGKGLRVITFKTTYQWKNQNNPNFLDFDELCTTIRSGDYNSDFVQPTKSKDYHFLK